MSILSDWTRKWLFWRMTLDVKCHSTYQRLKWNGFIYRWWFSTRKINSDFVEVGTNMDTRISIYFFFFVLTMYFSGCFFLSHEKATFHLVEQRIPSIYIWNAFLFVIMICKMNWVSMATSSLLPLIFFLYCFLVASNHFNTLIVARRKIKWFLSHSITLLQCHREQVINILRCSLLVDM